MQDQTICLIQGRLPNIPLSFCRMVILSGHKIYKGYIVHPECYNDKMKLLLLVLVVVVSVTAIIPLKIYATSDYDRGYNDGMNQALLNKQTGKETYNQGWKDGHKQLILMPLYKHGFNEGCADQKAGILTYDSQGTLDESVYDRYESLQYNQQWEIGYADGIDTCAGRIK